MRTPPGANPRCIRALLFLLSLVLSVHPVLAQEKGTGPQMLDFFPSTGPTITGNRIIFFADFDRGVRGLDRDDVFVQTSDTLQFGDMEVRETADPAQWDIELFGLSGAGTVTLTILANSLEDLTGNPNTTPFVSEPATRPTGIVDTNPAVPLYAVLTSTSPTSDFFAIWEVQFNSGISGLANSAILPVVVDGNLDIGTPSVSQIVPSRYQVFIPINSPGEGSLSFSIPAGVATNSSGIPNTATLDAAPVAVFDNTPPNVTAASDVPSQPVTTGTVPFLVSFDDEVTGFGDNPGDVEILTTGGITFDPVPTIEPQSSPVGVSIFTVTVTGITGTGSVQLVIPGGVAGNAGGLGNIAGSSDTVSVAPGGPDTTPPFVLSVVSNSGDTITAPGTASFTITFNEPVNQFTTEDLELTLTGTVTAGSPTLDSPADRTVWTVSVPQVEGQGTISLRVLAGAYEDDAGNGSIQLFTGPAVNVTEASSGPITVGVLTIDPSPGGSITALGGGDFDVTPPVLINDFLRSEAALQIRGGTVTGNGELSIPGLSNTDLGGPFTINSTNGAITQGTGAGLTVSGVPFLLCDGSIGTSSLIVNFRSAASNLANTRFSGVVLSPTGIVVSAATFHTTSNTCAPASGSNLVFTIGSLSPGSNSLSFSNLVSPRATLSNLTVTSGGGQLTGSATVSSLPLAFTSATFTSGAIVTGSPTTTLDDALVTFNNVTIPVSGNATSSGGTIRASNMNSTFSQPSFSTSSVSIGTVTMSPGGGIGTATADNFVLTNLPGTDKVSSTGGTLTIRGVRFPFPEAKFGDFGFQASSASLINNQALAFNFSEITLNSSGLANSGAGFDLVGLRFSISLGTPATGSQGLTFGGELALPGNLSGASLAANVTVVGSNVQLNSISFCTPSGDLKIKKANFNVPALCFSFDQGPPQILESSSSVSILGVFTLEAGFTILRGLLDRISIALSDLNRPIGNTGAFLQDISASVLNLARVQRTFTVTERTFPPGRPPVERTRTIRGVPPVQFRGSIGATAGPSILGQALLRTTANVLVDETQLNIDGRATIVIFEAGGAYVHIMWSGPNRGAAFGGFMVYISVLRGNIDAFIGFNGRVSACAGLALQVPKAIPLIGGITLGRTDICLSAPPFRLRGTVKITIIPGFCMKKFVFFGPRVCFPPRTLNVGFRVDERGRFSVNRMERGERFAEWEIPYFQPHPVYRPTADGKAPTEDDLIGEMVFFTNFYQVDKAFRSEGAFTKGPAETQTIDHVIEEGQPAIIRLAYENEAGIPDFTVTSPSGETYTPENSISNVPAQADPEEVPLEMAYSATPESRNAAYFVPNPVPGLYRLTILRPDTLGDFATEVLRQNAPPTFEFTDIVYDGDAVFFDFIARDSDDDANIQIYLDTDRQDGNGLQVSGDIPEADGEDFFELDLMATPIAAGWYWPYAVVDDGENEPLVVYSETPVFIPDVEAPPTVTNINASSGNGVVIITWDPIDDPDVVSYKVLWTSAPETNLLVSGSSVDVEETTAIIEGLRDATRYRFTILPVRRAELIPARRAAKLAILADAARSARASELSAATANNRHVQTDSAESLVLRAASVKGFELTKSEARSLAQQTAELSTPLSRRQQESAASNGRLAKRIAERAAAFAAQTEHKGTAVVDYVDGFQAQSDTLLLSSGFGNEPPVFAGTPLDVVLEGELYSYQAVANDPDGDAVTFALRSGPEGMTVSPAGLVQWQTPVGSAELYEIEIEANDSRGAQTLLSWMVTVGNVRTESRLRFVTPSAIQVLPGETWTYTPEVEGLFRIEDPEEPTDNDHITFELLDGPVGATIDTSLGTVTWPTTADVTGSHRVIIRVRQQLEEVTQEAFQELRANVEDADDTFVELEEEVTLNSILWLLQ